jgi:short-subunit dehydrogenase
MIGMKPDQVARIGIKALFHKKAVCIAGITNKIQAFFIRLLPKNLLSAMMKNQIKSLVKN